MWNSSKFVSSLGRSHALYHSNSRICTTAARIRPYFSDFILNIFQDNCTFSENTIKKLGSNSSLCLHIALSPPNTIVQVKKFLCQSDVFFPLYTSFCFLQSNINAINYVVFSLISSLLIF